MPVRSRVRADAAQDEEPGLESGRAPGSAQEEGGSGVVSLPSPDSAQGVAQTGQERGEAFLHSADLKMKMGDFGGVAADADRSVRAYPNSRAYGLKAVALARLAEQKELPAQERQARYRSSRDAASSALRLDSSNSAAYEARAWAQFNLGDYNAALKDAAWALGLNGRSAMAHAIRAYAHEALGRDDEKLAEIEEAARLDPARFSEQARAVRNGGRFFEPSADDGWQLLEFVSGRRGGRAGAAAAAGLLLLVGAALLGGAWIFFWSLRRASSSRGAAAVFAAKEEDARGLLGGKYQLQRVIGNGGMGQVWEARDQSLDRVVAVKKMSVAGAFESKAHELCLQEARTLAGLHHPNIVDIYEILDLPSGLYLVFEMLAGKTVHQLIAEQKRLAPGRVREILKPVCEALAFAHERGVIHRDMKPANIMVSPAGYVKVMDFGIARSLEQLPLAGAWSAAQPAGKAFDSPWAVARTRTLAGTPAYMAPEAASGVVCASTDVFALGVSCYEMLTGELPFGLKGASQKQVYAPASARVSGLPAAVDGLLARALEPSMEKRLKSVQEFSEGLEAFSAEAR